MAERITIGKNGAKKVGMEITTEMITQKTKKIPNYKCPEPDGAEGYWLKNLLVLNKRIEAQMDDIINNKTDISKWIRTRNMIIISGQLLVNFISFFLVEINDCNNI